MEEAVVRLLVDLNATFYDRFAAPFAASRATPQPGFERLLNYLWADPAAVLDVGCSDGRFARFLWDRGRVVDYTGVDFSPALLSVTGETGRFLRRDLSCPRSLNGLGQFDLVVCLSTLHHIPGHANRARLLTEMRDCLKGDGYVALANWQFAGNARQQHKLRPWSAVGLAQSDVEDNDYLLSWQRGGVGLRYVALLDTAVTDRLAAEAGLRIVDQYRSDGREGDLNLYTILAV